MDKKNFTTVQHSSSRTNRSTNSDSNTTAILHSSQTLPVAQPIQVYSENNNNVSNIIITQPVFTKLSSEIIKQEQGSDSSTSKDYFITKTKQITNPSKNHHLQQSNLIASVNLNPRETINGLSMAMTNVGAHLISALNPANLPDGAGTYFVSNLPSDLTTNYKLRQSSTTDLPSPSNSSNSSNPSSSNQHAKRHGANNDSNRKREVRLQKNREAARECRRKKKEYIKCLEERVSSLENQNKALIEELRQLKELYCQREETNNNANNNTTNNTTC